MGFMWNKLLCCCPCSNRRAARERREEIRKIFGSQDKKENKLSPLP